MAAAIPFIPYIVAGVSAAGAIMQGQAARSAANYNATLAEQNAAISRQEAAQAVGQQDRENYKRLGAIRAAQGRAGGVSDQGSVLDVIGDAAAQGEMQKQYIVRAGELKARGFQSSAALDRASGANAMTASYLQAGGALLGAAGTYYGGKAAGGGSSLVGPAEGSPFTLKRT